MTVATEPRPERAEDVLPRVADLLHLTYRQVVRRAEEAAPAADSAPDDVRASKDNLLAYVALREHDLRELQLDLAEHGLSSLGRLEEAVLIGMERVLEWLDREPVETRLSRMPVREARDLLASRSQALLGRPRPGRATRVMVTVDADAVARERLIEDLIAQGIDAVRINTAHDGPDDWLRIIEAVRAAEAHLEKTGRAPGRRCRVFMDLAGPKIRTGDILCPPGPLKLRVPDRDEGASGPLVGCIDATARFSAVGHPGHAGCQFVLAVRGDKSLTGLRRGDQLDFRDLRGRQRSLEVASVSRHRAQVHLSKSANVSGETMLQGPRRLSFEVQDAEAEPGYIEVAAGDKLRFLRDPGERGRPRTAGEPAALSCTLPEVLAALNPGDRVAIDDGRVWCVVDSVHDTFIEVVVVAPEDTVRIRAEKGLNFPDSNLNLPAFTDADRSNLPFIVAHADAVSLSFVHGPDDLRSLFAALASLGADAVGVVAKIETREAVQDLGRILLAGLERPPFGVMIARGDLAVEVGFENLALIQEEILCLCEAAHTPVIWATQVLDTLAKIGLAARAEITDAAMGQRAECVMLNKGPFILDAVRTLEALLAGEERHRLKKRQVFDALPPQDGLLGPARHAAEHGATTRSLPRP